MTSFELALSRRLRYSASITSILPKNYYFYCLCCLFGKTRRYQFELISHYLKEGILPKLLKIYKISITVYTVLVVNGKQPSLLQKPSCTIESIFSEPKIVNWLIKKGLNGDFI